MSVCIVRKGTQNEESHARRITDLSDSGTLHLTAGGAKGLTDKVSLLLRGDKLIARSNHALHVTDAKRIKHPTHQSRRIRVALKIHLVDARNKTHGVTEGRGIHVVLYDGRRNDDVPDRKPVRKIARYPRVDEL